jgi:hypothetical protein
LGGQWAGMKAQQRAAKSDAQRAVAKEKPTVARSAYRLVGHSVHVTAVPTAGHLAVH